MLSSIVLIGTCSATGEARSAHSVPPARAGIRLTRASATGTAAATLTISLNGNVIDATSNAQADSSELDAPVFAGALVEARWSGGVPGAVMTLELSVEQDAG